MAEWAVTTVLETSDVWDTVWRAVCCHQTQMAIYGKLEHLSTEHHRALWGTQEYYRVFSIVNGGRTIETDLFEGLREDGTHELDDLRQRKTPLELGSEEFRKLGYRLVDRIASHFEKIA